MLSMETTRFLMCAPEYFGVEYVINPWMQGKQGTVGIAESHLQWASLHRLLTATLGATVETVPPQPGLPDIVFTANAGSVRGGVVVPARFRHPERRGEEPHFRAWFAANGYELRDLPPGIAFEGAGDALFHEENAGGEGPLLWAAYGFRSDAAAHPFLAETFGAEVVPLALADPRFYHLDTCLCPLPGGYLLWYPPAFDAASQQRVMERVPAEKRLAVSEPDAVAFACNAVSVGDAVVLNDASPELEGWLSERGFTTHRTPLTEFMKSGGSAKCLTLHLDR